MTLMRLQRALARAGDLPPQAEDLIRAVVCA